MLFGYLTLAVAFFLSVVAAYYSVLGLVAIFSAAVIPVMIMGGALETGKVVAAMWLHRNWHRAPWTYKAYLLPSLLALMLLTSMGTFGYLSKAHSDQSLVSGDVQSKIALYDEKIRISRENIDANRAALKQLDAAVDQIMGRSTTEQGAERSVQIRRQQAPERQRLIREIEAEQKKISSLNEARAPIAAEVRKVEAEVGPIKYIAALIYGDNPENNLLESAVRWVIILIVIVFDPLAIVLILAGSKHLEWERANRTMPHKQPDVVQPPDPEPVETVQPPSEQPVVDYVQRPGTWFRWKPFAKPELPAYLTRPWIDHVPGVARSGPVVFIPDTTTTTTTTIPDITTTTSTQTTTTTTTMQPIIPHYRVMGDYVAVEGKMMALHVVKDMYPEIIKDMERKKVTKLQADNTPSTDSSPASFGTSFPPSANKGQLHVHTGTLPSKLFKFTGDNWIELDKTISDSYTHNEAYVKYLVNQLERKIISLEDLAVNEQLMVEEYIKNAQSNNNAT